METKLIDPDSHGMEQAGSIIRRGGLVAFPTETVYGLGGNALDTEAVAGIFSAKERPFFDPLIVHVKDTEMAFSLWEQPRELEMRLIEAFWPGPLTIVSEKKTDVPDLVTAGLETVGVRMPDHPVALGLIKSSGCPVAAPSANRFGRVSPTQWEHVMSELSGRINAVIRGNTMIGLESTVIRVVEDTAVVLRPGGVAIEDVVRVCRNTVMGEEFQKKYSPGHNTRHYAPEARIILFREERELDALLSRLKPDPEKTGIMLFSGLCSHSCRLCITLSRKGDTTEAAARLFTSLRKFESNGVNLLLAQTAPEQGLGIAINDRLIRAAGSKCRPGPGA